MLNRNNRSYVSVENEVVNEIVNTGVIVNDNVAVSTTMQSTYTPVELTLENVVDETVTTPTSESVQVGVSVQTATRTK